MFRTGTTTRRGFLRGSAFAAGAALGLPAVFSARVRGAAPVVPPSERITVGLIGVGRQVRYRNLPQFLAMPEVQLVAICDVDSWRMSDILQRIEKSYAERRSAGTFRGCDTYVEYRDLLARKDIDAVMISTPDHWHEAMAMEAMAAGKDVSLEKPITRTVTGGRKLAEMATRLKRIFRVDSDLRSYPHIVRAAELVRNGRIGKVTNVIVGVPSEAKATICPPQPEMAVPKELDYDRWQGPAPRAAYTEKRVHKPKAWERPGWMRHLYYCDGMITNWTTHLNDAAMWLTGLERTGPIEIEGAGQYPPAGNFWNVLLDFEVKARFADGLPWLYRTEKPFFRVEGTEGWVSGDFDKLEASSPAVLSSTIGPDELHFPLKSDKQDFIDSVKSRQETLEPAEVGHRVTSLGHLGHISIHLGQKLKWDPEKERFIGNDAANAHLDKPIHKPRPVA